MTHLINILIINIHINIQMIDAGK